jgi:hypothetical protein
MALLLRKVKSTAIIPDANMMTMTKETRRASDSISKC